MSHELWIPVPIGTVFAHLVAIEAWPHWQHGVRSTQIAGELKVGSRFQIVTSPHTVDGIVGELARPNRFGWAAGGYGLSFYQSWLLIDEPGGGTFTIFQEAARGPTALLQAADRPGLTRSWIEGIS